MRSTRRTRANFGDPASDWRLALLQPGRASSATTREALAPSAPSAEPVNALISSHPTSDATGDVSTDPYQIAWLKLAEQGIDNPDEVLRRAQRKHSAQVSPPRQAPRPANQHSTGADSRYLAGGGWLLDSE